MDFKVGDIVTLDDGARVKVTNLEEDVKHGEPGGDGITLNDSARRDRPSTNRADRWFYSYQVVGVQS